MHFQLAPLRKFLCAGGVVLLCCQALWGQQSEDFAASWRCLPEETALAVRIPDGEAFVNALIANTKFGSVLLNEQRRDSVLEAVKQNYPDEWQDFQDALAEVMLTTDDLLQLFSGESGYALLIGESHEEAPLIGFGWVEPGEDLASRALEVIGRFLERRAQEEPELVRIDTTLAGYPMMQLMIPSNSYEHTEEFRLPEEYEEMSDEEKWDAWEKAREQWQESAVLVTQYYLLQICTLEERVLFAHSFESSESSNDHPQVEVLEEMFGRFIAEHDRGEGRFVPSVMEHPGIAETLTLDGVGAFELICDVPAFWNRLEQDDSGDPTTRQLFQATLGMDGIGPLYIRSALDDTLWETRMSLSAPEPRRGILTLFETANSVEPPAWIPANAIEYWQLGFDLAGAYELITLIMKQQYPEQAEQWLAMVQTQVYGFVQTDLDNVLRSLGTRHLMVAYEPSVRGMEQQSGQGAMVWRLGDAEIWSRLFNSLAPYAESMPGAEFKTEQGYRGFRLQNEAIEGGLFLGNGYLVMAFGSQVLERTLSALNNPPPASDAFLGTQAYERAVQLLEPEPSFYYRVVNGNRYGKVLQRFYAQELEKPLEEDSSEESSPQSVSFSWSTLQNDKFWRQVLERLLPTAEEVENMLGVIVTRSQVERDGLHSISIQELPPPDDR